MYSLSFEHRTNVRQQIVRMRKGWAEDEDQAVKVAWSTVASGVRAAMAPADKKIVLVRWAELIGDHADEFALIACLDSRCAGFRRVYSANGW